MQIPQNELIIDVEESLKQERLAALWREYGPYLIGGAVMAVIATGAISGWRSWDAKIRTAQTSSLLSALESADAANELQALNGLRAGPQAMAYMAAAGALLQEGKTADALAVYKKAASDKSLKDPLRSLIVLEAVRIEWGENAQTADPKALLAQLGPLLKDEKNPWHWHALVEAAQILAHGTGDFATARAHLAAVAASDAVPDSLKQRARALDAVYGVEEQSSAAGKAEKEQQG